MHECPLADHRKIGDLSRNVGDEIRWARKNVAQNVERSKGEGMVPDVRVRKYAFDGRLYGIFEMLCNQTAEYENANFARLVSIWVFGRVSVESNVRYYVFNHFNAFAV